MKSASFLRMTSALLSLLLLACSGKPAPAPAGSDPPRAVDAPPAQPSTPASDDPIATDEGEDEGEGEPPADPIPAAAPWSAPKLALDDVPAVFRQQWRKADNRRTCAPLAPSHLAGAANARPRAAVFLGGWAVAYDQPGLRSAYGIAGSGLPAGGPDYAGWPGAIDWADGSHADYGLEGGTGPGHLAYLRVAGQGCLYNVWSNLGEEHLLRLLDSLRFVEVSDGE